MAKASFVAVVLCAVPLFAEDAAKDPFPLDVGDEWVFQIGSDKQFPIEGKEMTFRVSAKKVYPGQTVEWARLDTFTPGKAAPQQMDFYSVEGDQLLLHRRAIPQGQADFAPPLPHLALPLAEGKTWSWEGKFGDEKATGKVTIEGMEEVEVPAGKFKAWRVKYELTAGDGGTVYSWKWFAPGVGMVMQDDPVRKEGPPPKDEKDAWTHRVGKLKSCKLANGGK